MNLAGKTVLVTGASRGIGRSLVGELEERGARVLALIYGHAALLALRGARYYPHPTRRQTQS